MELEMFGQMPFHIILLYLLYGSGMTMAAIACLYLLLRRSNAFAPGVTPPMRLRRWTAAFFAVLALGHLWYIPAAVYTSSEDIMLSLFVGGLLDCLLTFPLAIVVMICMLQDRRRPLWPVALMTAPLVMGMAICIATRSDASLPMLYGYLLLSGVGLIVYMVRAVRQYRRWLRDNYADLEDKEVWQSFTVLAIIGLILGFYVSGLGGIAYEYIIQVCSIALTAYLLWRVETLRDLGLPPTLTVPVKEAEAMPDGIGLLLQQHCVNSQLYLQHDLTIIQLAQTIGTNRLYLSQYFSHQDTTYNNYINRLRIDHFVSLYRKAVAARHSVSAKQLASDSGYSSYSTFSHVFKQRMGLSVTEWMNNENK